MFGDYACSCGCGAPLGRPTDGVDGMPIEFAHVVSEKGDDEGFEWRSFTQDCWKRVSEEYNNDLEAIYTAFPAAPSID